MSNERPVYLPTPPPPTWQDRNTAHLDLSWLTDEDLLSLLRVYRRMTLDESHPSWQRTWHQRLLVAVRCVAHNRMNVYGELQDAARVPSTWEDAVASLPPDDDD
jgi:hypothetical protein